MLYKFSFLKKNKFVFMDYASGTPIDKTVYRKMKPFFYKKFFNPGAIYKEAISIRNILFNARKSIANILSANPDEIIFVDGGTEANNLVLRGLIYSWINTNNNIPHIITSTIEHSSILRTCKFLEENNLAEISYIHVNEMGKVDIKELKSLMKENTLLVSISYVNGEIGVIQDIKEISKSIRYFRKINNLKTPYFHTDAIQAVNCCNINVKKLGVDFMTINASKIYGPKKIAVLYKRKGIPILPIIFGGNQELGLRAGTENIPNIIGLVEALKLTQYIKQQECIRLEKIQKYMKFLLNKNLDFNFIINGDGVERVPNILNITFPGLSSEEIVLRLDAVGVKSSMMSACNSDKNQSHVIKSLRKKDIQSIRFSFGRNTSKNDIKYVVKKINSIVSSMYNFKL